MPPLAALPQRSTPATAGRRGCRRARRVALLLAGVVVTGAAVVAGATYSHHAHAVADPTCSVDTGGSSTSGSVYTVTAEQAGNAATIAAVAVRAGLPDHAVTIALATALQESKLRNLTYGDRDSLGLFQQRPSQGWGTAAQVADPVYASTAFYRALVKLPHWQTDDVATAAQAVQRSADGAAYTSWEDEARQLAIALTGERSAALTCGGGTLSTAKATTTSTRTAVTTAVTAALGPQALAPGANTDLGRAAAAWLVANAQADGITQVGYDGFRWAASTGEWVADVGAGATVGFTLAPAAD